MTTSRDFSIYRPNNDPTPQNPSAGYETDAEQYKDNNEVICLAMERRGIRSDNSDMVAEGNAYSGASTTTQANWTVIIPELFVIGDRVQISINIAGGGWSDLRVWRITISQDTGGAKKAELSFGDSQLIQGSSLSDYTTLRAQGALICRVGRGAGTGAGDDLSSGVYGTEDVIDGSIDADCLATDAVEESKIKDSAVTQDKLSASNLYPTLVNDRFDASSITTGDYALGCAEDKSAMGWMVPISCQVKILTVYWGGNGGTLPSTGTRIEVCKNGSATGLYADYDGSTNPQTVTKTGVAITLAAGDRIAFQLTTVGTTGTDHRVACLLMIQQSSLL